MRTWGKINDGNENPSEMNMTCLTDLPGKSDVEWAEAAKGRKEKELQPAPQEMCFWYLYL